MKPLAILAIIQVLCIALLTSSVGNFVFGLMCGVVLGVSIEMLCEDEDEEEDEEC